MSAIESCRTAALGGHVARCEKARTQRSRTLLPQPALPEVPGRRGGRMVGGARAELLPVSSTIMWCHAARPAVADIAYQNKAVI